MKPNGIQAHLANSLNGWIPELPAGVELIDRTENSLRFRVLQPEVVNPLLMRQLMDHQMDIVAFQQVPRSLEDAYLQAVEPDGTGSPMINSLRPAWYIVRREVRDQLRDWRIIFPVLGLTIFFPLLMNFTAALKKCVA